jgi:hypothetical protein
LAKRTIAAEALKPFEKTTTRKVTPDKNQQARLGRKYHITKRRHVLVVRALEQPRFSARGRTVQNLTVRKLAQCRDVVHPAPKVFTMSTVNLACDSALLKPICLRCTVDTTYTTVTTKWNRQQTRGGQNLQAH